MRYLQVYILYCKRRENNMAVNNCKSDYSDNNQTK